MLFENLNPRMNKYFLCPFLIAFFVIFHISEIQAEESNKKYYILKWKKNYRLKELFLQDPIHFTKIRRIQKTKIKNDCLALISYDQEIYKEALFCDGTRLDFARVDFLGDLQNRDLRWIGYKWGKVKDFIYSENHDKVKLIGLTSSLSDDGSIYEHKDDRTCYLVLYKKGKKKEFPIRGEECGSPFVLYDWLDEIAEILKQHGLKFENGDHKYKEEVFLKLLEEFPCINCGTTNTRKE